MNLWQQQHKFKHSLLAISMWHMPLAGSRICWFLGNTVLLSAAAAGSLG
jgi:hypothetical protein